MTRRNAFAARLPAGNRSPGLLVNDAVQERELHSEPAAVASMSPDKGAAVDLYTKKCHERWTE